MGDNRYPVRPSYPYPPPQQMYQPRYGPPAPQYQQPYYDQYRNRFPANTGYNYPPPYSTNSQYSAPYSSMAPLYYQQQVPCNSSGNYNSSYNYYENYNTCTDYTSSTPSTLYPASQNASVVLSNNTSSVSISSSKTKDDLESVKSFDSRKSIDKKYRSTSRNRSYDKSRKYERRKSQSRGRRSRSLSPHRNRNMRSRRRSNSLSPPRPKSRRLNDKTKQDNLTSNNEPDSTLAKWQKDFCTTTEEVSNKLEELSKLTQEEILEREKSIWTRTTPADLYYARDEENPKVMRGTAKLLEVCDHFNQELVLRAQKINALKPIYEPPHRKKRTRLCKHKSEPCHSDTSSSDDGFSEEEEENIMEELTRKQQHPDRLHPEMWYNDPGEMNDGPLCRCSLKSRKSGIRHGIYAGEQFLQLCNKDTNNATKLFHYRITISPPTNFLTKTPTIIKHDEHEFIFEGFSMFSHFPLVKLPTCKVIRFNIEYTILYIEEKHPDNFTIRELDLFQDFLFRELLELVDLDFRAAGDKDGCSQFHFLPRFVRDLPDNGREILSMKEVLQYLINSSQLLINSSELDSMIQMSQYEWQSLADHVKGMVVTYPGKKPCSVRVDQLDRNTDLQIPGQLRFPEIVHFGIRPPQLSYAGNPEYQKAWRDYVKFRHLLANMSKPTFEDKRKLEAKENKLQEMRTQSKMKRDVTVAVSAEGFHKTGIMCDIVQHAMLIPVLVCHLRFHHSLNVLEHNIDYRFQNRALLQLALTHPSYRENFGTNPDHARNSLTNCGIRQPEYGDRRIHYMNTRKRGINTLINIMSRFGKKHETESNITHNERLEFLGDAVVEFLSSIHLFRMFPDLEEGGLATYRAAIVQNQHLAVLARILTLDQFMLYAHGSDLCHDLELRHAMANCFEALMGALFLDGGIDVADKVFGTTLFKHHPNLLEVWENLPLHPLQEQEPTGDRQWIPNFELLQKLTKFEEAIGVEFTHIRLLARAFTDRSIGYTNLTLGSNQRLEFLGDTVLQLIASEYLYKYFPEHHEGHLSLLRSSLVNNRTQAVVCDDLGMASYAVYNNPKAELKTKDRADLLEAFIGALYIDQDLEHCQVFCQVTLFPRLQDFIMNQDWNDPKSKLQQCCLTLRTMDGGEPDIPVYKVIECKGPTNTRVYTVAVYFRNRRLAKATGHSIQQAEMNSAKKALEISQNLFPQLDHQKRVIAKSMKRQKYPNRPRRDSASSESDTNSRRSKSRRGSYSSDSEKESRCSSQPKTTCKRSISDFRDELRSKTSHRSTSTETKKSESCVKKDLSSSKDKRSTSRSRQHSRRDAKRPSSRSRRYSKSRISKQSTSRSRRHSKSRDSKRSGSRTRRYSKSKDTRRSSSRSRRNSNSKDAVRSVSRHVSKLEDFRRLISRSRGSRRSRSKSHSDSKVSRTSEHSRKSRSLSRSQSPKSINSRSRSNSTAKSTRCREQSISNSKEISVEPKFKSVSPASTSRRSKSPSSVSSPTKTSIKSSSSPSSSSSVSANE